MDLKALLVEAKQKVPPVLQVLQNGDETMLDIGGESFYGETKLKMVSHLSHLLFFPFVLIISQGREAAHFAVVSVIVSQTVQSWRPCRRNRSPTSDGKTTWLIVQWTSKIYRSSVAPPRYVHLQVKKGREIHKCSRNPRKCLRKL